MATICINYFLQSWSERFYCSMYVFFWGISAHVFCKDFFKWLTERFSERHGSFLNIDQMLKSSGFMSGEEGGHISLSQNKGKFYLHHDWIFVEVCDGTPLCWKLNTLFFHFDFISISAGDRIFKRFIGSFLTMEIIEYGDISRHSAISFIVLRGFHLIVSSTALIFFEVRAVFGRPVLGWSCVIFQFFVCFYCIIDRRFSNFKLSYASNKRGWYSREV